MKTTVIALAASLFASTVAADGFSGATFGAGAVSVGSSSSSVSNANGTAQFESYSAAGQTASIKFNSAGTKVTAETSGFDAAGSQGFVRGGGVGETSATAFRGGFAVGGSYGSGGSSFGGFDNGNDDEDQCQSFRGNSQNCDD